MPRTRTIMLAIKRGGSMRKALAVLDDNSQWVPGQVAEEGTSGEITTPTDSGKPKGFIVEGKKAGDSQKFVSVILDPVEFQPFPYGTEFTTAGSFASGINPTHGQPIYYKSTGELTNVQGDSVDNRVCGYYDAANAVIDGNMNFEV